MCGKNNPLPWGVHPMWNFLEFKQGLRAKKKTMAPFKKLRCEFGDYGGSI
jgi:hypothetical protein